VTDYTPLKITATLMAPVIFDRWQPLDGILGAAIIEDPELRQRSRRHRTYSRILRDRGLEAVEAHFARKDWPLPPQRAHFLPLAVWGHGQVHGLWVYCSSWAIPSEQHERDLVHFARRVNFEQVDRYVKPQKKRIYTAKGEFSAKYIPFQTISTTTLAWYVLGIEDEINEILPLIRSIGKKRRRGYGTIRRWTVDPIPTDKSIFSGEALMRPIPIDLLDRLNIAGDFQHAYTTYRPPYWKPQFAARCAISGQRTQE
jgi:hypothetical protein